MKITKNNYIDSIEKAGIGNLPEEIKHAHLYIMKMTDEGTDWSRLKTNESFKSIAELAFEKLEEYLKHNKGLDGVSKSKKVVKSAPKKCGVGLFDLDIKDYYPDALYPTNKKQLTEILMFCFDLVAIVKLQHLKIDDYNEFWYEFGYSEGVGTIRDGYIRIEGSMPGDEWYYIPLKPLICEFEKKYDLGKYEFQIITNPAEDTEKPLPKKYTDPKIKWDDKEKEHAKNPVSYFSEVYFIEKFIALDKVRVSREDVLSFIKELQKAIVSLEIKKESPYAKAIEKIQDTLVKMYNSNKSYGYFHINLNKVLKTFLKKSLVKAKKDHSYKYDLNPRQANKVELSGIENEENKILPSTEFEKMEFPTIGFTGKWLDLMGDPCAGFTAMVFGKPKMGKSYLSVDFAGYLAKNFGKVLYVAKEEKFGVTFAQKLKDKDAGHENLIISDSIPTDLSPYDFIFLDSINSLELNPEDLRKLKEQNPGKSFVYVFQTTKTGNFRGANTFQHDVDIVIEIPERGKAVQFGRFNQGGEMLIFDDDLQPEAELSGTKPQKKIRIETQFSISLKELADEMLDKKQDRSEILHVIGKEKSRLEETATILADQVLINEKVKVQTISVKFDELDSTRISHGMAYFDVILEGKETELKKVAGDDKVFFYDWENDLNGSREKKNRYPAWTKPKHLPASDHERLKRIYDLYQAGDMKSAMELAMNSDTIVREEIPGDIWKKLGGRLTKTGEEKLKKKKASPKQQEPVVAPKKKTLVFHGGVRTMKEVMERAWDLELNDIQYTEILDIAQEIDSNFVDMMDNLNFEFNEFFAIMKKAMNEWESKNGKLSTINRDKFDPKLFANRSDDENPAFIFQMTSNKVLSDAIRGGFDLIYMVRRELANRGLDSDGKWIGFEKAKEMHRIAE